MKGRVPIYLGVEGTPKPYHPPTSRAIRWRQEQQGSGHGRRNWRRRHQRQEEEQQVGVRRRRGDEDVWKRRQGVGRGRRGGRRGGGDRDVGTR
eukprot:765723-Hanusia_phi.AAC.1